LLSKNCRREKNRVQGQKYRVQGSGNRVQGTGSEIQGTGFRGQGQKLGSALDIGQHTGGNLQEKMQP